MIWYLTFLLVVTVVSKPVVCTSRNFSSDIKVGHLSEDFQVPIFTEECFCGRHGECQWDGNDKICDCEDGYKEFRGICVACNCGQYGLCEPKEFEEKTCTCEYGFAEKEGICRACDCNLTSRRFAGVNCTFQDGRKQCVCPNGFQTKAEYCQDIDECYDSAPCPPNTVCVNKPGTFECRCREGFQPVFPDLAPDVYGCEDIDECLAWPCQHPRTRCVNTPGSYDCVCAEGHYSSSASYGASYRPAHNACYEKATQWREATIAMAVIFSVVILGIGGFIKSHRGST